jgi:hypothetical protein
LHHHKSFTKSFLSGCTIHNFDQGLVIDGVFDDLWHWIQAKVDALEDPLGKDKDSLPGLAIDNGIKGYPYENHCQVFIPCPSNEQLVHDSERQILEHAVVTQKALVCFFFTYLCNCDLAHQCPTQQQLGWSHWSPKSSEVTTSMANAVLVHSGYCTYKDKVGDILDVDQVAHTNHSLEGKMTKDPEAPFHPSTAMFFLDGTMPQKFYLTEP